MARRSYAPAQRVSFTSAIEHAEVEETRALRLLARRSWHAESLNDADLLQFQTMLQMTDIAPLFFDELTMATRGARLGFMVRIEDVASGDVMEAVEIRKDAPAASVFAPPAGYRKVD